MSTASLTARFDTMQDEQLIPSMMTMTEVAWPGGGRVYEPKFLDMPRSAVLT